MEDCRDLTAAADRIAGSIDQFERGIDRTIADFGRLLYDLASGRASSTLSAGYGHDVFEAAIPALSSMVAARTTAVDMHKRLTAVQRHQRITLTTPPTDKGANFASTLPLRVVDAAA